LAPPPLLPSAQKIPKTGSGRATSRTMKPLTQIL